MKEAKQCCLTCQHCGNCPVIVSWVAATEAPIEVATFSCSEYAEGIKRQEMPDENRG